MELRDWRICLLPEPAEDDSCGQIKVIYGRKVAEMRVNSRFREYTLENQRDTIIHELVHCHLESPCNMVQNDLEALLGSATDGVFWEGYKRQMEYAVDALAKAIAKHLPLIDWPT